MYRPTHFAVDEPRQLHAFIEAHPLGSLVVHTSAGLSANHIPMLWESGDAWGRLHGHIARANTLWREVAEASPVLVLFGGTSTYITPSWYPSKQATGQVVPTWNYSVVHAHGTIQFFDAPDRLLPLVTRLTHQHESHRADPWAVSDAPSDYIDKMLRAIVGFEIRVARLEGKFKASQNRTQADREGVMRGLAAAGMSAADCTELVRDP